MLSELFHRTLFVTGVMVFANCKKDEKKKNTHWNCAVDVWHTMCALVQTESKIEMKTNSKSAKSHLIRKFRAKETKCERASVTWKLKSGNSNNISCNKK